MNVNNKLMKRAYLQQRNKAKHRGIMWDITYEDWCEIWIASGVWHLRGRRVGQYQMCRHGDMGPYSYNNVRIDTVGNNIREALGKRVRIGGVVYPNVTCAARVLGLKRTTLVMRLKNGYYK
jgi:hypothetical protein